MNVLRVAAFLGAFVVANALAQSPGPTRVRGTITGLDGNTVSVKSREGQDLKIELAPNATFAYMTRKSMSDIKPGTPLGATVVKDAEASTSRARCICSTRAARFRVKGAAPGMRGRIR